MSALSAFLREVPISTVTRKQKIRWLSTTDSLEDALRVLDENAILSAPVIDVGVQTIVGVLDMFDIVIYILKAVGLSPDVDFESIPIGYLESLEIDGKAISSISIGAVLGTGNEFRKAATAVVQPDKSLQAVLDLFIGGVDRVLVAEGSEVVSLYSQSDLLSFLAQSLHLIGDKKLGRTLQSLNLTVGPMLTAHGTTQVLKVLQHMSVQQSSAVAILDYSGRMVASFSSSSLKGLNRNELGMLHLSASDFLHRQRCKDRPLLQSLVHQRAFHPSVVTPGATLEHALLKMAAMRAHRVWVADEFGSPLGVVSISDMLKVITSSDMEIEP